VLSAASREWLATSKIQHTSEQQMNALSFAGAEPTPKIGYNHNAWGQRQMDLDYRRQLAEIALLEKQAYGGGGRGGGMNRSLLPW